MMLLVSVEEYTEEVTNHYLWFGSYRLCLQRSYISKACGFLNCSIVICLSSMQRRYPEFLTVNLQFIIFILQDIKFQLSMVFLYFIIDRS